MTRGDQGVWRVPAALATGSLLAPLLHAIPPPWVLCAMLVTGVLCLLKGPLRPLAALLLACTWSLWNFEQRLEQRLPAERAGTVATVCGTIVSIPQQYDDYATFRFRPDSAAAAAGRPGLPPLLLVRWYRSWPALAAGQHWRLELLLKPPWAPVNFRGPDREKGYFASGIGAVASVRNGQPLRGDGGSAALTRWRERVFRAIAAQVADPRQRGLVQALAVGDRSGIGRADRRLLILTGTAHLLAISGLHIGLAAAGGMATARGLAWLLPFPGSGRALHSALICGGLLAAGLYAALAGFGTSTVRALAMLAAVLLAALSTRALHPARPWLLALCAVLLIDPFAPLGAGFWLSFLAVAALLFYFVPRSGSRLAPRPWWRTLLAAQGVVMVALLPVSAAWFQAFSGLGYAANLVAIPLVSLVTVPLVLAGTAALSFSAGLAGLLWTGAGATAALLLRFLEWLAALQATPLPVAAPNLPVVTLALVGAFLLLLPRGVVGRWSGFFLLVPLFLPPRSGPPPGAIELEVLDAGQGTAVLLRTAGNSLLYDSGPGDGGEANVVSSVIVPAVGRGPSPERILISHGDLDHAGGLQSVQRLYPRADLRANLPPPDGAAQGPTAGLPRCQAPQAWRWGDVQFEVLHPTPALPYLGNDSSCVLEVRGPGGNILLGGDVSAAVEQRLLQFADSRYDLLLVPHHGSTTSSSSAFVRAARPRVAVAAAGLGNRFGFPRPEIRQRYERAGARFLSTGACGALRFLLSADGRIEARSARRERPGIWRWPPAADCPDETPEP